MRYSLLVSSLLVLVAALGTSASGVADGPRLIRRAHRLAGPSKTANLTDAQLHAVELTRRRPTRRSTARLHRRSALVVETVTLPLTTDSLTFTNGNTGATLRKLAVSSNGLTFGTSGDGMAVTTTTVTGALSAVNRRITVPAMGEYSNLGLMQYSPTSGLTMGPGLSNGLLLTGIKDPGTAPGDAPAHLANYNDPTGPLNRGAETDIWNIDFQTGEVKVTWVNPAGDVVDLMMITDGITIAATGDFAAFNNLNGGNWFNLAFTFPVASSG